MPIAMSKILITIITKIEKKNRAGGGGLRTYFFKILPRILRFLTLPLEIPDKTKLHPSKLRKIVLHPSQVLRPTTKTPENFT